MRNSVNLSPLVRGIAVLAVCALALALGSAGNARAATLPVSSPNDSGRGSLRQGVTSTGSDPVFSGNRTKSWHLLLGLPA